MYVCVCVFGCGWVAALWVCVCKWLCGSGGVYVCLSMQVYAFVWSQSHYGLRPFATTLGATATNLFVTEANKEKVVKILVSDRSDW